MKFLCCEAKLLPSLLPALSILVTCTDAHVEHVNFHANGLQKRSGAAGYMILCSTCSCRMAAARQRSEKTAWQAMDEGSTVLPWNWILFM
jgi:hypothetical protein